MRTRRLATWLIAIGLALGGTVSARLSRQVGCTLSRQTLLRIIRHLPLMGARTPQVLGVDDVTLSTRQTYGTVLIDLERRQPVALLPDRDAETLAQWLRAPWREGHHAPPRHGLCRCGAPRRTRGHHKVAERLHRLQNLVDALAQVFHMHRTALAAINDIIRRQAVPVADGTVAVAIPPPDQTGEDRPAAGPPSRLPSPGVGVTSAGWPGHAVAAVSSFPINRIS